MPFDVLMTRLAQDMQRRRGRETNAMIQPDTWIVCLEANHEVTRRSDHQCVATHRDGRVRGVITGVEVARIIGGSLEDLEIVSVQMERMLAWRGVLVENFASRLLILTSIVVVQDDLHNLVLVKNEGVRVLAVDGGIRCVFSRCEGRVESWHFRRDVRDVVEEGTKTISTKISLGATFSTQHSLAFTVSKNVHR